MIDNKSECLYLPFSRAEETIALTYGKLADIVWPGKGSAARAETFLRRKKEAPEGGVWYVGKEGSESVEWKAAALAFPRVVGTSRGQITILALAGVCSHPEYRGQGLGAKVVRGAFSQVEDGEYPCSLYQTSFKVEPFYKALGARRIFNPFINSLTPPGLEGEALRRSVFWDEIAMIYPSDYDWPDGEVDLLGDGY